MDSTAWAASLVDTSCSPAAPDRAAQCAATFFMGNAWVNCMAVSGQNLYCPENWMRVSSADSPLNCSSLPQSSSTPPRTFFAGYHSRLVEA